MTIEPEEIDTVPCCRHCGSERVAKDAWACWNPDSGMWELEHVFDDEHCHQCEGHTRIVWARAEHPPHKRIRELNDLIRTKGAGNGTVLITPGILAEGAAFATAVVDAIRRYDEFNDDNDPWGEHDFGTVDVEGRKVIFKIDYYADASLTAGSENPANEGKTHRLLTILLASEW